MGKFVNTHFPSRSKSFSESASVNVERIKRQRSNFIRKFIIGSAIFACDTFICFQLTGATHYAYLFERLITQTRRLTLMAPCMENQCFMSYKNVHVINSAADSCAQSWERQKQKRLERKNNYHSLTSAEHPRTLARREFFFHSTNVAKYGD